MGITFGRVSLGIASSQMREVQFLKDGSSLDFGTMQGAATTAYCVGKIFWSLVADRLGGFNNLKLTMGCTVIGGIMCGFSRSDYYFVVFWCIQMFFSSGVWGGTCIVIRDNYHESEYGRCLGTLGFFSRLGATLGALCLTPVERVAAWQTLFLVGFSVSACISGSCLLKIRSLLQKAKVTAVAAAAAKVIAPSLSFDAGQASQAQALAQAKERAPESDLEPFKSFVQRLVHEKRFWTVLAISILLTLAIEFQNFVPVFVQDQFNVEVKMCGYGTAFFIAGCMCVPIVGWYYDKMEWKQKLCVMPSLTIFAAVMCLPLMLLPPVMVNVSSPLTVCLIGVILFLFAGGFTGPYYIIPAEYAFIMGGKQFSGFVMNVLDAISYIFAIVFDVVSYKEAQLHGWSSVLFFLMSCCIVSAGLTYYYYYSPRYDNEARLTLIRKGKGRDGDETNEGGSNHNPLAKAAKTDAVVMEAAL